MLVLSRKLGEQVIIGDNIRVTVVAVRGNQVRIGFDAPAEVRIVREELCESPAGPIGRREHKHKEKHHAAGHP